MLPKRSHFCQISLLKTLPTQFNPKTFFSLRKLFFGYLTFQASNFSIEIKNCAKKFKELLTLAENISKKIFWKIFLKYFQVCSKCFKDSLLKKCVSYADFLWDSGISNFRLSMQDYAPQIYAKPASNPVKLLMLCKNGVENNELRFKNMIAM